MYANANDISAANAQPYPAFNSDNVAYNVWHSTLMNKIAKANALLANPKIARN